MDPLIQRVWILSVIAAMCGAFVTWLVLNTPSLAPPESSCRLCLEIISRSRGNLQQTPLRLPITEESLHPCDRGNLLGMSALHVAAGSGDPVALRALLSVGADPNGYWAGYTPLDRLVGNLESASSERFQECFQLLVDHGADVTSRSGDLEWTPLHKSALSGKSEPIHWLIAQGADVNSRDELGRTPLHWAAASHKSLDGMLALVKYGADCSARDNDGKTPLDLAESPIWRRAIEEACNGN